MQCPEGYYTDVVATPDLASCKICPAGFYCVLATSTPADCPGGYYCLEGSVAPTPCPIGRYGNDTSMHELFSAKNSLPLNQKEIFISTLLSFSQTF